MRSARALWAVPLISFMGEKIESFVELGCARIVDTVGGLGNTLLVKPFNL
jgi:hypothetical protein